VAIWWADGASRGRWTGSPLTTLAVVVVAVLAAAFFLERWPSPDTTPRFHESIEIGPDATVFLDGPAIVQDRQAVLRAGEARLLVRSATPRAAIRAVLGGRGSVRFGTAAPIPARPAGALVALPVEARHVLHDAEGRAEYFSEERLRVEGEVLLRFGDDEPGPSRY
jgi:hypothetical protein